jgi:hypothetical protein
VANNADVQHSSGHSKEGKASLDHIYDLEDPRGYFETLWRLDYRSPQNGFLFFPTLFKAKKRLLGGGSEEATVVIWPVPTA